MKFELEGHAYSPKMIIFSFIGIIRVHLSYRYFFFIIEFMRYFQLLMSLNGMPSTG